MREIAGKFAIFAQLAGIRRRQQHTKRRHSSCPILARAPGKIHVQQFLLHFAEVANAAGGQVDAGPAVPRFV